MGRWLFRAAVVVASGAGFLAGLITLGQWASDQVRDRPRYRLAIQDIDCAAPPGMGRAEFLEEVQYHGRLPDHMSLLDDDLTNKLTHAFCAHPWVAAVREIRVQPSRRVEVLLNFRQPVLAVRIGDSFRVVDAKGILLPRNAAAEGLPLYQGPTRPPQGTEGSPWGDPAIEAQAKQLALDPPRQAGDNLQPGPTATHPPRGTASPPPRGPEPRR